MPFFSVIVSTYNRAPLLKHALKSVLNQYFADFELVVVDDGSTDYTSDVVSKLMRKDSRIKYLYQENAERGAARNRGIKLSSGSYIVFLDSDDLWLPVHLSVLYKAIQNNPSIDLYSNKYNFFNEKGNIYSSHLHHFKEGLYSDQIVMEGNPFGVNVCVKKSEELKLFPEERHLVAGEDWMFLLMNLYGKKIFVSDEVTILMREHTGRSMMSAATILAEKRLNVCNELLKIYKDDKLTCKKLKVGSYRFCSIHYYIDHQLLLALKYWVLLVRIQPLKFSNLTLFMKILITKKVIEKIKPFLTYCKLFTFRYVGNIKVKK
jgi:glycosyltransferase involved in cell wall biosynthesis